MKQMNKFKLSAVAVLLSLGCANATFAETSFDVNSFQLSGDIQALTDSDQIALAEVLAPFQGKGQTLDRLKQAQKAAQEKLSALGKGQYEIVLPEQRVEHGNVLFQLVHRPAQKSHVNYIGSEGFDAKNIENSIPSLKAGKFYEDGRQWFEYREFAMAQENPLKVTRMHYELNPQNKASELTVAGYSPYGKNRTFVAVDNYGSREFNRGRVTVGHVNANLTGKDDVLSVMALTNFKAPSKSYALGLSYSRPFYDNHQTLGFQVGYSHLDSEESDGLPSLINRKMARGKTTFAGVNWSYFLPSFDLGVQDQFKINAGYSYRHYDQRSSLSTSMTGFEIPAFAQRFAVAGVNLGVSGEVKITPDATINMEVTDYYYSHKIPGSRHMDRIGENYNRDYNILFYRLGYSQDFANGWNFNTQFAGQYTRQDLSSIDTFAVSGVYGVRGFKYANVSGERALVWRNEISMPKYTQYKISPYAFYDLGQYRANKVNAANFDSKHHTISSTGVGVRAEVAKNLNADVFMAHRLANSGTDNLNNNRAFVSDKTTFWGRLSYSF